MHKKIAKYQKLAPAYPTQSLGKLPATTRRGKLAELELETAEGDEGVLLKVGGEFFECCL